MKAEWRLSILKYREEKAGTTTGRKSLQGFVGAAVVRSGQCSSSSDTSSISQYRLLDTFPLSTSNNEHGSSSSGTGKVRNF